MGFKPMLAATVTDRAKLYFPYLASPKLDGIRCVILNGEAYSRSLKPIRNKYIADRLRGLPDMDGELIVGSPTEGAVFNRTTRGVMSAHGEPDFRYYVFDSLEHMDSGFQTRLANRQELPFVTPVHHEYLASLNDLTEYEVNVLNYGYEGVMLRSIEGPYKFGRATPNENYLWKLKQFTDGELQVTSVLEGVRNNNFQMLDALGQTTRSTHQENMEHNGKVGTIVGFDLKTRKTLSISPGRMTHPQRHFYFDNQTAILGRIVNYRYFTYGVIDAPRFAVFQSFRHGDDM